MKRLIQSDITKTLIFFALTVVFGAVISPWLYNLGKFLAEVGESRQFNIVMNWLAEKSGDAGFTSYFICSVVFCALLLAGPFIMWLNLKNRISPPMPSPWSIRLPERTIAPEKGQALCRNPHARLHLATGFLLTGGLLTLAVWILLSIGWFTLNHPVQWWQATSNVLVSAIILAVVKEWLFRGIILGIFMRSMRPAPAIIIVSVIYGWIHFALPPDTLEITEPSKADAGFRMMELVVQNLLSVEAFAFSFVSLVTMGLILAYARYRSSSLWLPIGLHAGWLFSYLSLQQITGFNPDHPPLSALLIGPDGISGILPLCLLITTGLLVHVFVQISDAQRQSER